MDQTFGTLRCTLLDRRSSVPLGGARVTCVWREGRVSVMDADERGSFTAELPQGVYDLVVSARGYLSHFFRGIGILGGYHQDLTRGVDPGEGAAPGGEPATAIAGFIKDRVGRPVQNLIVQLRAEDGNTAYTTRTDKSGAYIINGVLPAMYDLHVRAGDRGVMMEHVPIAHVNELTRVDLKVLQL